MYFQTPEQELIEAEQLRLAKKQLEYFKNQW